MNHCRFNRSTQHFTEKEERKRLAYTAADLAAVWDRWGRGESSKTIARVMGRGASVYTVLPRHGGMRPVLLLEYEHAFAIIPAGNAMVSIIKITALVSLTLSLPLVLSAAECDSILQISDDESQCQTVIENVSARVIVAYVPDGAKPNAGSETSTHTRTYTGSFSVEDSLDVRESMEIGDSETGSPELSVAYVRFADGGALRHRACRRKYSGHQQEVE